MSMEKFERLMNNTPEMNLEQFVVRYGNMRHDPHCLYDTPNITHDELLRMQELASEDELLAFAREHGIEAYHPNTFFKRIPVINHKDELRKINGGFAWVVFTLLHHMYYSMPTYTYTCTGSGCNAVEVYKKWHNGVSVYPSVVSPRLRLKKNTNKKEGRRYGRLVKGYGISQKEFDPTSGEIKHGVLRNTNGAVDRTFALIPHNTTTSAILKELRHRINWREDWQALRILNSIVSRRVRA